MKFFKKLRSSRKEILDPCFGKLVLDEPLWSRYENIKLFENDHKILLSVEGHEGNEIVSEQRKAFEIYQEGKEQVLINVEDALFDYYQKNYQEMLHHVTEPLPSIKSSPELQLIITPYEIIFPFVYDDIIRYGFRFWAPWDEVKLLCVVIENGELTSIGMDEIVP